MKRSNSLRRTVSSLLACVTVTLVACATQEEGERGAFVVRLGSDTLAVESFVWTPERLEATAVSRSPRARVRQTVLSFAADGGVSRYESSVRDAGAAPEEPPRQHTVITYGAESAIIETTEDGETSADTVTATPAMIPSSLDHFFLEELIIRLNPAGGPDTVYRPGDPPSPVVLRRIPPDSVTLDVGTLGIWRAHVDDEGRILGMYAGALGRSVERVAGLDVEATAQRWADEDARGEGMGPLSPRDTLVATASGANITVDYSRPSKRGRQILGDRVPWNEVWRTGANTATHLTTDRDLVIGGTPVPAGTYTIFTIPTPDDWTLIINRETGQAGTAYDSAQDLARLEMDVELLDDPVERLTIGVKETEAGGVLAVTWESIRASIPLTVLP